MLVLGYVSGTASPKSGREYRMCGGMESPAWSGTFCLNSPVGPPLNSTSLRPHTSQPLTGTPEAHYSSPSLSGRKSAHDHPSLSIPSVRDREGSRRRHAVLLVTQAVCWALCRAVVPEWEMLCRHRLRLLLPHRRTVTTKQTRQLFSQHQSQASYSLDNS